MTSPPADAPATGDDAPSLAASRLAAAAGVVVAVALVVVAFSANLWIGVVAAFFSPVVPMGFVLALEALRR